MKKLIILFIFTIGLIPIISVAETTTDTLIVKIEKNLTIYHIDGISETNQWGPNVVIHKKESLIPDDVYFRKLGIPESEWKVFSNEQNGIYYSGLEKLKLKYDSLFNDSYAKKIEIEKEDLRKDYNKLFASNTVATDRVKVLEILLIISFIGLILFAIGFFKYKNKIKDCVNLKQKIKEASAKDN